MNKPPAFQFYARDWLSDEDVIAMRCAERGAYVTLLCVQWLEGSIPADHRKLFRLIGDEQAKEIWAGIADKFPPTDDPQRLANHKLEQIRAEMMSRRQRQAVGAEITNAKRSASRAAQRDAQRTPASASASASALKAEEASSASPPTWPDWEPEELPAKSTSLVTRDAPSPIAVVGQRLEAVRERSAASAKKADELRALALIVFAYWRDKMGKSQARTHPNEKRLARIVKALRLVGGDASQLLYAIDGAKKDDFLMGRDPKTNGKKWNDIRTIFRDVEQIERLCELVTVEDVHPMLREAA